MSRYTEKDAAKDTKSSGKEVREAWHTARDDAANDGGQGVPEDRHSDSEGGGILSTIVSFFSSKKD